MWGNVAEWTEYIAALTRVKDEDVALSLSAPLAASTQGGSGSFLARGSDGKRYFVKPLNNRQSPRVCFTELALSRLGEAIGAPVCHVVPIRIGEDVAGWEFVGGRVLEPGIASASEAVSGAVEDRALNSRTEDDNARRHVGVLAMSGWLGGGDEQWLYVRGGDNRIFSHDHGHFLPGADNWTSATLLAAIVAPPTFPTAVGGHVGLNKSELTAMSERLQSLAPETIAHLLSNVPGAWPISSAEIATLGYYADQRRLLVATELEKVRDAI